MIKCKECGTEIISFSVRSEIKQFYKHLKNEHNLENIEYVIKHDHNGIIPKCACGCNNERAFYHGSFRKYFSNHKDKMPPTQEAIQKGIDTKLRNGTISLSTKLKKLDITEEKLKEYYDKFINFKISLSGIMIETGIDKRIIKKYWKEFNLIEDIEIFNRIIRKHQGFWSEGLFVPKTDDYDKAVSVLPSIYNFMKTSDVRHTLGEIVKIFDLNLKPNFFYKLLIDNYGYLDIDKLIKFHNSSYAEIEFYNVLKYYFGNKVQKQFKLEGKIFDYILGKILIEYDGTYWHSSEQAVENDKYKDELAIKNGYIIIRIAESNSRDIGTLLKIKELYDKSEKI